MPGVARVNTDDLVAGALIGVYLVVSAALLPVHEYPRALGGGIAVFALIAGIARTVGRGKVHGLSVLAVACASAALLAVPTFPAMGGNHLVAVPLAGLGVQAAMLLWAVRRWAPRPPAKERTSLLAVLGFGAGMAAALSVIATIPILFVAVAEGRRALLILLVYPAYFAGMLAAATIFWLLQRTAHLAAGRYLIGALGGFCGYAAFAPIVALIEGETLGLEMMIYLSSIPGGIVGPALALELGEN